ncbi:MAG: hypothetical protein HYT30_01200 [Parcubacteria group bacterium]|nr:hypothetical protein [Parcubacteria group bacterium]
MLQRLLLLFLIIAAIGILIFRLNDSGEEIERRKQFFTNPFTLIFESRNATSTTDAPFPFPAVPDIPTDYPALSFDDIGDSGSFEQSPRDELLSIERQYDELSARIVDAKQFGSPSPYRGLVRIGESYSGATSDDPSLEYITLIADSENTAPVQITGWTLQSVYSRGRYTIPSGTRHFVMGEVPQTAAISLDAGDQALIVSGRSPVGTSFKENACTGYLGQFQTFVPSLDERCPSPENEVLTEPATSRTADPACVAYARSLPICRFIFGEPPPVSDTCSSFMRNALTYNGCLARHKWRPSFDGDTWRIFLGAAGELWSNDHEVIRLLDAQGRTIDVWTY